VQLHFARPTTATRTHTQSARKEPVR
jgi:hypothetical protein